MTTMKITETDAWKALEQHAREIQATHLRQLLQDAERCQQMRRTADGIVFDFAPAAGDGPTIELLLQLAEQADLKSKIDAMRRARRSTRRRDGRCCTTCCARPRIRRPTASDRRGQDTVADVHQDAASDRGVQPRDPLGRVARSDRQAA
jgi:glucose-6-phosphate isomerase